LAKPFDDPVAEIEESPTDTSTSLLDELDSHMKLFFINMSSPFLRGAEDILSAPRKITPEQLPSDWRPVSGHPK
jgi:hypothetical protein